MAAKTTSTREKIEQFLGQKRLAIVGVSRDRADISRQLMTEFRNRGYDAVPVTPTVTEMDGLTCYARVQDIVPPVKAVLIMTPPKVTEQIVRDCAAAGVSQVWLYRGLSAGAVSAEATAFCEEHGISVVAGFCPFMFFPENGWFHQAHGFFKKLAHTYPN